MDSWYQGASTPEPEETRSLSGPLGSPLRAEPPAKPPSSGPRPLPPPPRLARHSCILRPGIPHGFAIHTQTCSSDMIYKERCSTMKRQEHLTEVEEAAIRVRVESLKMAAI